MLKSASIPDPLRSLSTGQKLVVGIVAAVVVFLLVGSLNQANDPNQLAVGLQTQPFIVLFLLAHSLF
jgi:hypothetical protein